MGSLNAGLRPFPAAIYADPVKALEGAISEFSGREFSPDSGRESGTAKPEAGDRMRNFG